MAWRRWDSRRCTRCGTFPEDWLDDDGRPVFPPPFEAEVVSCHGCREVADREQEIRQAGSENDAGLSVRLGPWRGDDDPEAAARRALS